MPQLSYKPHKLSRKVPRRQYFRQQKLCSVHLVLHWYLSYLDVYLHDLISNLKSCNFCWASFCHPCYVDTLEKNILSVHLLNMGALNTQGPFY